MIKKKKKFIVLTQLIVYKINKKKLNLLFKANYKMI
jgi:hypothetical protein